MRLKKRLPPGKSAIFMLNFGKKGTVTLSKKKEGGEERVSPKGEG